MDSLKKKKKILILDFYQYDQHFSPYNLKQRRDETLTSVHPDASIEPNNAKNITGNLPNQYRGWKVSTSIVYFF